MSVVKCVVLIVTLPVSKKDFVQQDQIKLFVDSHLNEQNAQLQALWWREYPELSQQIRSHTRQSSFGRTLREDHRGLRRHVGLLTRIPKCAPRVPLGDP